MLKKRWFQLVISLLLLFSLVPDAHAYLDPGTGSMLLQGLLAFLFAVVSTISIYWRRFKRLFRRSREDRDQQ